MRDRFGLDGFDFERDSMARRAFGATRRLVREAASYLRWMTEQYW